MNVQHHHHFYASLLKLLSLPFSTYLSLSILCLPINNLSIKIFCERRALIVHYIFKQHLITLFMLVPPHLPTNIYRFLTFLYTMYCTHTVQNLIFCAKIRRTPRFAIFLRMKNKLRFLELAIRENQQQNIVPS
jgi:hypothetical protein